VTTGVLLALTGPEEAELVSLLDAPDTGLQVVRRCADVPEVVAAGLAGLGSVAVISADLAGVDRPVLRRLAGAGVRTVVVAPAEDVARCRALGASVVTEAELGAREWAGVVGDLARSERPDEPAGPPPETPAEDASVPRGRLAVVWGPRGSPGRTTIAVNLAHELSGRARTLLVDADTEAPSVTQALGVLDETAGIAAAARLAGDGRLDADALRSLARRVGRGPRLLSGLTRADRWRELPAASLDVVWDGARALAEWSVVDVGAGIDDPTGGFAAGVAPRRHQATLSALAAADVVVVVGAAEPVGMHRLVMALQELTEAGVCVPHAQRIVVVNRVRGSAAGANPEQAVIESLARFAGVTDPLLVPDDRPAHDRAVLRGAVLAEVAPGSRSRAAVQELADRLLGSPVARRPGRGRRRGGRRTAAPAGPPAGAR
jgi:MinD-like ATPase involved in chromosome partitioning or flagellar assembly